MIKTAFLAFVSILLWASCANVMTPTGGEKDMLPPKIVNRSMKDSAIQFKGGKVQIDFDEFIQLKDIQNQLVVSPIMKAKPNVTVHKKTVSIEIPDSLLEANTTYKVNLGNAISDLHEGNPYENLSFTFSTGSYFDSLSIKGQVIQAQNGLADTSVWIVLYPSSESDTVIKVRKPMYIQKPINGSFELANLPNRSFHIFALQDLNNNMLYDLPIERMAFFKQLVNPTDSITNIALYTFQAEGGKDTNSQRQLRRQNTVAEKGGKFTYKSNIDTAKKSIRSFDIQDSIILTFSNVIKDIDVSKVRLYQQDILDATAEVRIDSTRKKLIVSTDWQMESAYSLQLIKGFAVDSNNVKADSASLAFKTKRASDYGFATLITEKKANSWIELMQADKIIARKNAVDTSVVFELLNPGNYKVRILHDENGNAIWDTGDFKTRKMPEIVEHIEQDITIKANWENKLHLKLDKRKTRH